MNHCMWNTASSRSKMRDICTGEKMERKKEKNGNQDKINAITADKEVSVQGNDVNMYYAARYFLLFKTTFQLWVVGKLCRESWKMSCNAAGGYQALLQPWDIRAHREVPECVVLMCPTTFHRKFTLLCGMRLHNYRVSRFAICWLLVLVFRKKDVVQSLGKLWDGMQQCSVPISKSIGFRVLTKLWC